MGCLSYRERIRSTIPAICSHDRVSTAVRDTGVRGGQGKAVSAAKGNDRPRARRGLSWRLLNVSGSIAVPEDNRTVGAAPAAEADENFPAATERRVVDPRARCGCTGPSFALRGAE